jgi:hypothetical protein
MTFVPYTVTYHKDGSRTVTKGAEVTKVHGRAVKIPCVHLGGQAGNLDCDCAGAVPYFTCNRSEVEYAIRRKISKPAKDSKTGTRLHPTSCLSCELYQPSH